MTTVIPGLQKVLSEPELSVLIEKSITAKGDKSDRKQVRAQRRERQVHYQSTLAERFADPRWADLFAGDRFLLIDGGATGGLEKEWLPAGPLLKVAAIEPRADKFGPRYLDAEFETILIEAALDRTAGERGFYLNGSMSSFLLPDGAAWRNLGFTDRLDWVQSTTVKTTTLDNIVRDNGLKFVDFIKLDTQGTELDILKGGPRTVASMAAGMRIEMLFTPLYEGQPLFADVDSYTRAQGFELIDLVHVLRYPQCDTGGLDVSASADRVVVADGLYFRTPAWVAEHIKPLPMPDRIRYMAGAVVGCMVYQHLGQAARYLHASGELLPRDSRLLVTELVFAPADRR
jgi:FkbM family methyltransferase